MVLDGEEVESTARSFDDALGCAVTESSNPEDSMTEIVRVRGHSGTTRFEAARSKSSDPVQEHDGSL